jgi:hypothetical protein
LHSAIAKPSAVLKAQERERMEGQEVKLLDLVLETQEGLNAGSRKRNREKRDGTDNRYDA